MLFSNQIEMFMFMTIEYVNKSDAFKNLVHILILLIGVLFSFQWRMKLVYFGGNGIHFPECYGNYWITKTNWNDDDFSDFLFFFFPAQFAWATVWID